MSKEAIDELKRLRSILSGITGFEDDDQEYIEDARKSVDRIIEALAEQPAQQEPVAAQSVMTVRIWRDKNSDQNAEFKNWHKLPDGEHILYTSPQAQPARKPLTREQVKDLLFEAGYVGAEESADFINGLRHGEAAHGIKGDA